MRSNNEIIIDKEEYNELIEDSHSLRLIFNLIESQSFIDENNKFVINLDDKFISMLNAIAVEEIDGIEQRKRLLLPSEEIKQIVEEALPTQEEQTNFEEEY